AAVAARLVRAHGSAWEAVWARAAADPALAARVDPALPYVGAEYVHAVEAELACTLADLLVRRTPLAFETRDAGRAAARVVAPLVAPHLGWDDAAVARALAEYDAEASRLFGVDP
ncbi:glycerol-3-phosphate dehydrogenase C-terminal domain-containing protein, partial [Roseisolibacter sp. H3M3-2]|uniref:glycerol-3-phosphate dehydrogenase C-terminal domain-containing protein n=1 Tax=Roseisolibacter sp. H3M3-2 TaxID=3031323 RepID=UPI0023DB7872